MTMMSKRCINQNQNILQDKLCVQIYIFSSKLADCFKNIETIHAIACDKKQTRLFLYMMYHDQYMI